MQDARTVKLVPAETKTITTEDGATHEISRYIVMPDDQASSPNANTSESFKITIIPPDVNGETNKESSESKQLRKDASEKSGDSTYIKVKLLNTDDKKTDKTPSLVQHIKFKTSGQGIDGKVTKQIIPTQHDSKTTVYIRHNGKGESVSVHLKKIIAKAPRN